MNRIRAPPLRPRNLLRTFREDYTDWDVNRGSGEEAGLILAEHHCQLGVQITSSPYLSPIDTGGVTLVHTLPDGTRQVIS